MRPGVVQESSNGSPKLTGHKQTRSSGSPSPHEALPAPKEPLLCICPQQTEASGVWESHVKSSPAVVEEFKSSSLVAFSLGKL